MPTSVALSWDLLSTANLLADADRPAPFQMSLSGSAAPAWAGLIGEHPVATPADLIIMPGLGISRPGEIAPRLEQPDAVAAMLGLRDAAARGAEIATSCSGVFVLGEHRLPGPATGHDVLVAAPAFRDLNPRVDLVMEELIVRDGQLTTAGASLAQMDLMLHIVARHGGAALAERCSRYLLLDQRRSQSRCMALSFLAAADERVARAEAWARGRFDQDLSVDDLAAAGLAPRTFARRLIKVTGLSPIRFLQRLRVEAARELIETSRMPVEEVAVRVGYADPSALHRIMDRDLGVSPSHVRQKVGAATRDGERP